MIIRNFVKKIIFKFFVNLININLFFINKNYNKFIYSKNISFGDTFAYYLINYNKIISKKFKILLFSTFEEKIARIFFDTSKIKKTFFFIPSYLSVYEINNLLKKKKNFKPKKKFELVYKKNMFLKKHKQLLHQILKKNYENISFQIKELEGKKFVLLFIKHYNTDTNNILDSNSRQTANLKKIYKTINFLIKKKITIVVLGDHKDKGTVILKKYYQNKKGILFFCNLSKKQKMIDQLFLHDKSLFSIGSDSGVFIMSFFLKKKIIIFDGKSEHCCKGLKNFNFLSKKIIINNKINNLSDNHINNYKKANFNYKIQEVNFLEIKKAINKII